MGGYCGYLASMAGMKNHSNKVWQCTVADGVMSPWLRDIRVPDFSVHTFSPRLYSPVAKWTFQSKTLQSWTFQSKTFQSWTFQSKTFQSWTFQSQTLQSNGKMNFSVPDFSVLNFTVQDLSVLNFSVPDLSVPDFTVPRAKWTLQSKTKTTTFWVLSPFFDRIWLTRFSLPCSFKHMPSIWFLR